MMMDVLDQEIRALAFLVCTERDRQGHDPVWDQAGTCKALRQLVNDGLSVPAALAAGYAAAADPKARTPLAMTWAQNRTATPSGGKSSTTGPRCGICNRERAQHDRAIHKGVDLPHEFELQTPPPDPGRLCRELRKGLQ
ncbi:hypothetical protein GCM10027418_19230 [Mariniluteicoccus endophyticus]